MIEAVQAASCAGVLVEPSSPRREEPARPAGGEATTSLWVIAGLAAAPAVAQGFGRFAYALVLPAMRGDLGWSYADAGAISTANAVGYLIGALAAAFAGRLLGAKRAFSVGLLISALAIAASGAAPGYWAQAVLRFVAGLSGGVAFVIGGALAAAAASGKAARTSTALGVYVAGAGASIALSAFAVPPLVARAGWQGGWIGLGLLSLIAWLVARPALSRTPEPQAPSRDGDGPVSLRPILFELVAYGLMGAGYIAYATFVIAFLKAELGFTPVEVSAFWATLGLAAVASTFAWGPILARLRGGLGFIATAGAMTGAVILVLVEPTRPAAYVSAALFGGAGFAAITAVTTLARRIYPPHAWTSVIGTLTVAFGIGQIVGPVLSGAVSDGHDGLRAGLALSVWILLAGLAVAALQRERRAPGSC